MANDVANEDVRADALRKAEAARCKALVDRDFDAVDRLLSPELSHTHTNGKTEDRERFMTLLRGPMEYIGIERRDLTIRLHGNVGVMEGLAVTTGRIGGGDPMTLTARVLQVWVDQGSGWRMVAFQATMIPV